MSFNEHLRKVTNNQQVIWMEKFLAREDRVIEIVKRYKSKLAELNVATVDRNQVESHIKSIRKTCRSLTERFNKAIIEEDYDEIDRVLKLKNHGCTGYLILIKNIVDYYDINRPGSTPDQFEELAPELIEYPAPAPDPYY